MEYDLPVHKEDVEEGRLIISVLTLRNQLKKTERSLQSLGEQLYSERSNENSDNGSPDRAPAGLTLKDLEQPQTEFQKSEILCSGEMSLPHASPRRSRDKSFPVSAVSYRHIEQENKKLREKLNSLREQNASLVSKNHHLMNEFESSQAELTRSKARVCFYESALGTHISNVPQLEEQIINLEAKVDAQDNALRDAEVHLEESQKLVSSKEHFLHIFKDEYKKLRAELLEQRKRGKRAEQQRNEALNDAEELTKAFQLYKEKLAKKLEKVQAEEETVQKNLMNCEKEREILQKKCNEFEIKFKEVEEQLRQVKTEHCKAKEKYTIEAKNAELDSILAQANERIFELENKLVDTEYILKEKNDLMHQNKELQVYIAQQNEKLQIYQDEILIRERGALSSKHLMGSSSTKDVCASSWEHNSLLIADLRRKLSMRDAEIQKLQASLTSCGAAPYLFNIARKDQAECYDLEAEPVKLNGKQLGDEKFQQQEMIVKELEKDKQKLIEQVEELSTKLTKAEDDIFSLKVSMDQRTTQFQGIQKELLEKAANSSSLEHELQDQLDKEYHQLKMQESTISVLQQDILSKQHQLVSLDQVLTETKEKFEKQDAKKDEAMKKLQNQVTDEMNKVRQLDSALGICKEEILLYLHQLEESKEKFDKQITKKSEEMQHLQKELTLRTHSLQEITEENVHLELTVQQQQHMLHQGTVRIGELEESQGELEKQISKLEKDLQREKANSREEIKKMEEKLCVACEDADLKSQQVLQLTSALKQLTHELDHARNELVGMEKEIKLLRYDSETKSGQRNHLEMRLQQMQAELNKKTELVTDLESKLQNSEAHKEDFLQQREELEHDLQSVQNELKDTAKRLQELQSVLQNTQLSLEEKKTTIKDLAGELRRYKTELEDRDQRLADMNQALQERNWELKQRAAQVTQLDMTIREHRGELEQKIIRLEGALETSELDVNDHKRQLDSLDEKLQHTKDQLHDKDFELLQKDQELNQFRKEIERKQLKIADIEKTMKEQEQCITDQYQEGLDVGQQVRLLQEQQQHTHLELLETRHQLSQTRRETERLKQQLEETNHLLKEKEARASHLAEELTAVNVHENKLEARMQAEIKLLKAEIEALKDFYKKEIAVLQRSHAEVMLSANSQKSSNMYLNEKLKQRKQELREAQETVSSLQRNLQTRNDMIQAANDALLVKESEVTRLQARISWFERTETQHPQNVLLQAYQKHPNLEIQDSLPIKSRKLHRSRSASDISLKDYADPSSLDLPEDMLTDLNHMLLLGPAAIQNHENSCSSVLTSSLDESQFNPLTYTEDEGAIDVNSDCSDLQTLSGMLNYINKEMKISEISLWEIQATDIESMPKEYQ
ncbi:coiled-coil domain-containing protein 18 isoform X4 [Rhinatrema bivittatum]|uniref:coiled-coil domain-containing protein 18 isoform X4 n=1 Tax=Rhinatrema bivittatum TaxID=194408 RepID=UPI00112E1E33|nr:coiled-coil domain-containing protein 18 isoform X4 [Rhinatrema bivittatum]